MSADTVVPLTDAYRVLRAVWPPEAPFAGVLARTPDDRTVLLVASREVEGWSGAEHGTDGHVLGPRDLVRCRDGVAVELDACTETLERLLDRREAGGLLPGESVTLAVALCRGLAELAATRPRGEQAWPPGRWWITAEARPLFVHDAHGRPADFETRTHLARIRTMVTDAALSAALDAAEDDPLSAAAEDALFDAADAAPVATRVFAPATVRSLPIAAVDPPAEVAPRGRLTRLLEPHVDRDIGGLVSDAVHAVRTRLRGGRARPRPWLLAGGTAAVVLAVGVMWPAGADEPAPAAVPVPSASATAPEPVATEGAPSADGPAPSAAPDFVTITQGLLAAREACDGDEACLGDVMEDPEAPWPDGFDGGAQGIVLLDEFGDVAVLRVEQDDEAAVRLVVIAESDGRFRLRDVRDAPSQDG